MSRRRRRQRDTSVLSLPELAPVLPRVSPSRSDLLRSVEDRRFWHPEGEFAPYRDVSGVPSSIDVDDRRAVARSRRIRDRFGDYVRSQTNAKIVFADTGNRSVPGAHSAVVCVRRKQRREVLFALRRTRRGAGARRRRRTWRSEVGC